MSNAFKTAYFELAFSFGRVTGTLKPALHEHHEQLQATSAFLEFLPAESDEDDEDDDVYVFHGYQFIETSPELKAQGIRLYLTTEGHVTSACVLRNDQLFYADEDRIDVEVTKWQPQHGVFNATFNIEAPGHRNVLHTVAGNLSLGRWDLLIVD
ncbi:MULTISPECIES: hypothetical protein [unclassified Pseudomonas]|uniref:hypothetical protein n=1 Tax=unclassified Pseudomonas TaxID=196821 RepID=UPI00244A0859|nr:MULTISPECIES: hypothetical protein [unclassified Pseudomonas]MDH0300844.1 hypothetical protein [Pseudomonas sp. GD04091]MDH1985247.1 hypothetical protein [Pseudomonas sp. GD03689]